MYSVVLNLLAPEEAMAIGYADDITLIMVAEHLEDTQLHSSKEINVVARKNGSSLHHQVLQKKLYPQIRLGNHIISLPSNSWEMENSILNRTSSILATKHPPRVWLY